MPKSKPPRKKNKHTQTNKHSQPDVWSELNTLKKEAYEFLQLPVPVLKLVTDRKVIEKAHDPKALLEVAGIIQKDFTEYKDRLDGIAAKHAGRTSPPGDADALMEAFAIGEEYQDWLISYQAVVLPNVNAITTNVEGYADFEEVSEDKGDDK